MVESDIICIYDGPSTYSGAHIRAYVYPHENDKTDSCAGLLVAPANIINYFDARRSGEDAHVCGKCEYASKPAGGNGHCYVGNGSRIGLSVKHPLMSGIDLMPVTDEGAISKFFRKQRFARLRSAVWGDAAALPVEVWKRLYSAAQSRDMDVLGYTHGYATLGYDAIAHLRDTHVASVSSPEAADLAMDNGFRYFRSTRNVGEKPRRGLEFHCPASAERGHVVQCSDCMACGTVGNADSRRNGLIYEHDTAGLHAIKRHLKELSLSKTTPLTTVAA